MTGRAPAKRRTGKAEAPLPSRRKRRGLWIMIGFCLLVFVIIVVYETQREFARQQQAATGPAEQPAETPSASLEPATLAGRLKEYYRSHELPLGWVVIGSAAPDERAGTVRIGFSPPPQDRRYGQAAPLEDVQNGTFCPVSEKFWNGMEDRKVTVELSDKTGLIRTMTCKPIAH
ncbi:MAG: hypothetical protein AB7P52_15620 [Alphaproteobacteria bacterium]